MPVPDNLYSATYSNVPVYEFLVNGGSVMRRKHDDWVNATHILKAANFAKAKRTRILEKDVQTGQHEKVQGGYGKYQGTWIPLEEAKLIAQRFNVDDILAPVLTYHRSEGDPEPPLAPKHQHAKTVAAAQAAAAAAAASTAANSTTSVESSRSGSPPLAGRRATYPLKRTKSQKDNSGPPKKRGRPKRVNSVLAANATADASNIASAGTSILESTNSENFDILKTVEDRPSELEGNLTKSGLPRKKRGRKPKVKEPEEVTVGESILEGVANNGQNNTTTINNNNNASNNSKTNTGSNSNSIFQTPMKNTMMNNRLIKSFVNEKSSPLNESDLHNYFSSETDFHKDPVSSDIEESNFNNIFNQDPSSSPSEFMSDDDLANALKSPENLSGLNLKPRNGGANNNNHNANVYQSFINNGHQENHNFNGYFSARKKLNLRDDFTHSIPTPTSSFHPSADRHHQTNLNSRLYRDSINTSNYNNSAAQNNNNSNISSSNLSINSLNHHQQANHTLSNGRWFDDNDEFTKRLISYFMKPDDEINESEIPNFLLNPPKTFNINKPIDPDGNTALHWACAMGNLAIIELLIKFGANYRARNRKQETPIMRSVRFNNSYTKRTFAKITDLLRDTLFEIDGKNRTVLHHITLALNSAQKYNSARYYLEILLAKISELYSIERLNEFINLTDRKGNPAIFYALSNSSRKCIKVLLSYNARTDIKNNKGETANDLMVVNYPSTPKLINSYQSNVKSLNKLMHSGGGGPDSPSGVSNSGSARRRLQQSVSKNFGRPYPVEITTPIAATGRDFDRTFTGNAHSTFTNANATNAAADSTLIAHQPSISAPHIHNSNSNINVNSNNSNSDSISNLIKVPKILKETRLATENAAISLIKHLDGYASQYAESIAKKQHLIVDLNQYYKSLSLEISTIEKNIISSSAVASRLISSDGAMGPSSDLGDDIEENINTDASDNNSSNNNGNVNDETMTENVETDNDEDPANRDRTKNSNANKSNNNNSSDNNNNNDSSKDHKSAMAQQIITKNNKKLSKKIIKQTEKLNDKINELEKLLNRVQLFNLTKATEDEAKRVVNHGNVNEARQVGLENPFIDENDLKGAKHEHEHELSEGESIKNTKRDTNDDNDKITYCVELSKLQVIRAELTERVLSNFTIDIADLKNNKPNQKSNNGSINDDETDNVDKDNDLVITIDNIANNNTKADSNISFSGDVEMKVEEKQEKLKEANQNQELEHAVVVKTNSKTLKATHISEKLKQKNKKINLYRRLVAACCNVGINEVDNLVDVILQNLNR